MKRTKNQKNSLVDFCEACFPEVSSQVVLYHLTIDGKTAVGKLIYREKN